MSLQKSSFDLEQMRIAGRVAAEILTELSKEIKPGVSCGTLDERSRELCKEHGVIPAFLGQYDFPGAICISVNDEVVHGVPYAHKILKDGDLVKLDFGVIYRGYYSDHCRTFAVGKLSAIHQKLLAAGQAATLNGVKQAVVGNRVGDISYAMQSTAEENGFSIVRTFIGHGIGKKLHEPPEIPAFGKPHTGPELKENMVICVECQVCEKGSQLYTDRDGWTARTKDGGYSVMFEQMVRVAPEEAEVLTPWLVA